jgi:hypothetical protein
LFSIYVIELLSTSLAKFIRFAISQAVVYELIAECGVFSPRKLPKFWLAE